LCNAGNAWTDPVEDNKGAVDFWYSHALISDATREGIYSLCNFSHIGPLKVLESVNVNKSKVGSLIKLVMFRRSSIKAHDDDVWPLLLLAWVAAQQWASICQYPMTNGVLHPCRHAITT
jgi:hypothetical protein